MITRSPLGSNKNKHFIRTTCRLCHGGCILRAHVSGGRLIKLEGDPEGPLNLGSICEKGSAAIQYVYSPYRIKYPMKRIGARGEGRWQRIPWDEALDITAEKLDEIKSKYGGETIAYAWGTGRVVNSYPRMNFYNGVLGTPNGIGIGHICLTKTRVPVVNATLGSIPGLARFGIMRDFDRANCIVAWGDTLIDSRNDRMGGVGKRLANNLAKHCKLIVIDPVFTRAASKADIWLPIRPGTDLALALSWLNVIIDEKLYDSHFVTNWTNAPFLISSKAKRLLKESDILAAGDPRKYIVWDMNSRSPKHWDPSILSYETGDVEPALKGVFCISLVNGTQVPCRPVWQVLNDIVAQWNPEKAAKVTWISPDKIRDSARMFATSKPSCIEWGVSMSQCSRSTATNQAILHLKALTGNLDIAGGNAFWHVPGYRMPDIRLPAEQEAKRITGGYPFSEPGMTPFPSAHQPAVWKAAATGTPYRIRALYGETSNPLVNHEKPDRYVFESLKKIDFVVWTDITMTPSNQWADIILPVSTPFERDWCDIFEKGIFAGRAVIEPQWESRSDFDVWRELCHRMGHADLWPWRTEREFCDWKLEPLNITFEELKETCFYPADEVWRKHEKGLLRLDKRPGFPTSSGKLEIYASKLEQAGIEPLPMFTYPPESYETKPELAKDFPLILLTGSRELNFAYFHSQYHYVPWLREMQPHPVVLIHPETAGTLAITNGNWVWIETRHGRARFKAEVSKRIHPKVVSACHAWWYPELPGPEHGAFESNVNVLVDPYGATDPATGTTELRGLLCKVYKAKGPPAGVKG